MEKLHVGCFWECVGKRRMKQMAPLRLSSATQLLCKHIWIIIPQMAALLRKCYANILRNFCPLVRWTLFLIVHTGDSQQANKERRLQFRGVNSDFVLFATSKNIFCDIRKNTPKSYEMGLSPSPPSTENVQSFATFSYCCTP